MKGQSAARASILIIAQVAGGARRVVGLVRVTLTRRGIWGHTVREVVRLPSLWQGWGPCDHSPGLGRKPEACATWPSMGEQDHGEEH